MAKKKNKRAKAAALGDKADTELVHEAYRDALKQRLNTFFTNCINDKQEAGENMVILDLRSSVALEQDPFLIQDAIHLKIEDIEKRREEFPRDRDIIVYCSCPNEATAARVALLLQRHGFTRVRPLLGGIDAWREQNYPLKAGTSNLKNDQDQTLTANTESQPSNSSSAATKTADSQISHGSNEADNN